MRAALTGWAKPWLGLLGLGLLSFFVHLDLLLQSPYANGWDGYYYLVQLKSLVETGEMHSRDVSPIYPLMWAVHGLVGDFVLAYKYVSAGLAALFTVGLTGLGWRMNGWKGALLLGLWTLCSPALALFAAHFPKNLLGMDLLVLFLAGSIVPGRWWKWVGLAGAAWAHRMTTGLGVVFWVGERLTWRRFGWAIGIGALVLLLALALPGLFHLSDLERFGGSLEGPGWPHWCFAGRLEWDLVSWTWGFELVVGSLAVLALVWAWARGAIPVAYRPWFRGVSVLMGLLFFPFWKMDPTGMGYRFFLAGLLLAPVGWLPLAGKLGKWGAGILAALLLCVGLARQQTMSLLVFDPPVVLYEGMAQSIPEVDPAPELLIAHKGLAEYITFTRGVDVLPWQPEYEVPADRLYRIAAEIFQLDLNNYLSPEEQESVWKLRLGYWFMREDLWQALLKRAGEAGDEELLERMLGPNNPHVHRPAYLRGSR